MSFLLYNRAKKGVSYNNSDAGKIAGGNTAGTRVERRVNLNIGKDYYQILSEAEYTGTNAEDMQHDASDTHKEGQIWHYFLNQIYYKENADGELEPYMVFVNVRENKDGSFVYGFETYQDGNVEKAAKRKRITLTSALAETDDSANSSNSSTDIISETSENSNKKFSLKDSLDHDWDDFIDSLSYEEFMELFGELSIQTTQDTEEFEAEPVKEYVPYKPKTSEKGKIAKLTDERIERLCYTTGRKRGII